MELKESQNHVVLTGEIPLISPLLEQKRDWCASESFGNILLVSLKGTAIQELFTNR